MLRVVVRYRHNLRGGQDGSSACFHLFFFCAVCLESAAASGLLALGCKEDFIWVALKDKGNVLKEGTDVNSTYVDGNFL